MSILILLENIIPNFLTYPTKVSDLEYQIDIHTRLTSVL